MRYNLITAALLTAASPAAAITLQDAVSLSLPAGGSSKCVTATSTSRVVRRKQE